MHTEIPTTPPPQTTLRLSIPRTRTNRILHVKSPEWHALRAQIIERDNRTCSSCGYVSPHPNGRGMKVAHLDGDSSNNDLANLRVHCPPCEAIRHCGFPGIKEWIALARSDMDQVEIVRRTRALLEASGSMPTISEVDPASTRVETETIELANRLMEVNWEELTKDERSLKGFFMRNAMRELFAVTIANRPSQQLSNITFSPRKHSTLQKFFATYPPSTTSQTKVEWISVQDPVTKEGPTDVDGLTQAWNDIQSDRLPITADLDVLALKYNLLTGKWMVFARHNQIDSLWAQIASATHAGRLGFAAKVSPRNEADSHVVCVYTRNYTDRRDVYKVRSALRRLGVHWKIAYKPEIYTHCGIYENNAWDIAPTRYHS